MVGGFRIGKGVFMFLRKGDMTWYHVRKVCRQ